MLLIFLNCPSFFFFFRTLLQTCTRIFSWTALIYGCRSSAVHSVNRTYHRQLRRRSAFFNRYVHVFILTPFILLKELSSIGFVHKLVIKLSLAVFVRKQVLIVQAMRPDRLQSAMSLFASRALGKVHSHNDQFFPVLLFASLYIMLKSIYAQLGWSSRVDIDFLKVLYFFFWLVKMPF